MIAARQSQTLARRFVPAIRAASTSASSHQSFNPLRPNIPLTDLGLPRTPLPAPIPDPIPHTHLTPETLRRLHALAALEPPAPDSRAETQLLGELGELLGLMDLVKAVELNVADETYVRTLLTEGVGEMVFDSTASTTESDVASASSSTSTPSSDHKTGRDLLQFATRRMGDYYAFRTEPPADK